jgi:hypothetical protein
MHGSRSTSSAYYRVDLPPPLLAPGTPISLHSRVGGMHESTTNFVPRRPGPRRAVHSIHRYLTLSSEYEIH